MLPGPAAAKTKTIAIPFEQEDQSVPKKVTISPRARTAQIAVTWPDAGDTFDVTKIHLIRGRALAGAAKLKPGKLKITKKAGEQSLDVRVKNVRRGRLAFTVVATILEQSTPPPQRSAKASADERLSAQTSPSSTGRDGDLAAGFEAPTMVAI